MEVYNVMNTRSNPNTVKTAEPLTFQEVQSLLNFYSLKARIAEKRRSKKIKMLGDLLALRDIIK
jgi:hypothetical protein